MGFTLSEKCGEKVRSSLAMDCRRSAFTDRLPQLSRRVSEKVLLRSLVCSSGSSVRLRSNAVLVA